MFLFTFVSGRGEVRERVTNGNPVAIAAMLLALADSRTGIWDLESVREPTEADIERLTQ